MLEDRSYMRRESFGPQWSMTMLLLVVNVLVYFLQAIYSGRSSFVSEYFALSNRGLSQGYVWQLITFQFLHGSIWHLLFNLLGLFFFGRMVEERLGRSSFLKIYFLSGTIGGILQVLMGFLWPEHFRVAVLGASAGVFGLVAAATMLEPDSTILVSFIIPLKAKYFLIGMAAISFFYMFSPHSETAHAAHLGGILTGVGYLRWGGLIEQFLHSARPRRREFIRAKAGRSWGRSKSTRTAELEPEEFISREVDPILDKISAHGIQSLTPREREILETARNKMEHRR